MKKSPEKLPLLDRIRRFYRLPDDYPELNWTRTRLYRRRLEQVKSGWIVTGTLMLLSGSVEVVCVLGAFAGFLSLAFLDPEQE
ncbi:MAG: hypothetical protein CMI02_06775 [Oceanospirillaceae bacterium]|nr:hypothetical protein [Oceanospirillaceae bacterium]MBT11720.1 hypothetical protein [Oceanospirillaceae bacterium]|tara:strand:- start:85523 stop:85771 length:249 start_codon:yes stop_codon:yes gene_type:complete